MRKKLSFRRAISRLRGSRKAVEVCPAVIDGGSSSEPSSSSNSNARIKAKRMTTAGGARPWMKIDRNGQCEVGEWDKTTIAKRAAIPARDLRILGPVFSHSCTILAREKAMVVNLEFIKAIVTAEEVFLLDPLHHQVLPFVHQLRQQQQQQLPPLKSTSRHSEDVQDNQMQLQHLPFEFQVLEIALQVLCSNLDSSVTHLEKDAYPALNELARNVNTKNLEHIRSLKTNLTRLLARVQKVRDEIEHLLDDNNDMAQLHLTRKSIQNQQPEDLLATATSNALVPTPRQLTRLSSLRSGSVWNGNYMDDVEDLEMLLDAYFMQLDGTRNKILSVREYIDDTEDYVNIQLDHRRNQLIQLQLTLIIGSFSISLETIVSAIFGMNMPCSLFETNGVFEYFVGGTTLVCVLIFMLIFWYARWKKLLGS